MTSSSPAAASSGPSLECRGVTRRLQSGNVLLTVLDGIDLRIERRELVAIVGPSGSGKSTLLGLLAGLDQPSAGSVLVEGVALEGLNEDALSLLRRDRLGFVFQNFQLLGNLTAREANVFVELRRLEKAGERYDTIVLDPPAFAKNKASVPNALAGYKEINLRALRLLAPGGYLVSCSCSYNVNEEMFAAMLHEASIDSHTPITVVEKRMQGRDHPVLVGAPETHYLKCFILRRVE